MCIHKMRVTIDIILFKQRALANGEHPIAVRLTQKRNRKYVRTGLSIDAKYWDDSKNKPKINCPNREYIENIITEKLAKYQKQILEFQSTDRAFTINQLIEIVDRQPLKHLSKALGCKDNRF